MPKNPCAYTSCFRRAEVHSVSGLPCFDERGSKPRGDRGERRKGPGSRCRGQLLPVGNIRFNEPQKKKNRV